MSFYVKGKPYKTTYDSSAHESVFDKSESSNESKEDSKGNNFPELVFLCGCEDYIECRKLSCLQLHLQFILFISSTFGEVNIISDSVFIGTNS